MLYNLPASKIFILLLFIPSLFAISVIYSISDLRTFRGELQVFIMIQPPLAIFSINSLHGLGIISRKSCRPRYSCLVISRQAMSMLQPSLKFRMMHLITISEVSSAERIAEDNVTVLKPPYVAILIMQFFNET